MRVNIMPTQRACVDVDQSISGNPLELKKIPEEINAMIYSTVSLLSPTKEEVNAFARVYLFVCLSVCLSVNKITQKRVHGFG